MKRLLTLFLAVIITLFLFTSCGKEEYVPVDPTNEIETSADYSIALSMIEGMLVDEPMCEKQVRDALWSMSYSSEEINTIIEQADIDWRTQAVRAAVNRLDVAPHSRQGLIDILVLIGYSEELATYGADHCEADWTQQCLFSAMIYLEDGMTKLEITQALMKDKYTESEIAFATNACFEG